MRCSRKLTCWPLSSPGGSLKPPLRPNSTRIGYIASVFAAPKIALLVWHLAEEHQVPVGRGQQVADLGRRHAGRIGAAYQPAHARAHHDVHRDVVLLEPLEHPHMRDSARGAAAKRQADPRPGLFRLGLNGAADRIAVTTSVSDRDRSLQVTSGLTCQCTIHRLHPDRILPRHRAAAVQFAG